MITSQNRPMVEARNTHAVKAISVSAANRIVIIRGMRRFLSISFITLALMTGAVGAAPTAYAAPPAADETGSKITIIDKSSPDESLKGVMAYIVQPFAWLTGVAVITLDNAVYYTVVKMGDYIRDLSAVGVAWRIMRDIGNIMLIFGFLATGIAIILNVDIYGWGKKMLPGLLIAAVFINFSLFISEAVIDVGNVFATQFYTQINGGDPAGVKEILTGVNQEGISNKIMSSIGLQSIYGEAQDPEKAKKLFEGSFTVGFMSIILFIITAFVMFSLAFVLISRFVYLVFIIILSPVGFAGSAIPMLAGRSKKWREELLKQTFIAPALLILLYVALAVITDVSFLTGFSDCVAGVDSTVRNSCSNPSYVGYAEDNFAGFASVILSFLVAMGLLLYVVYKAKDWGAVGAEWATKTAGKLTFGATAWAGRRTAGRISNFTARSIRSGTFGKRLQTSETGRLLAGLADRGAKASFDVRGIKMGGGLNKIAQIDAGTAQKGGYKAREDELIKARTDYAKSLRQSTKQRQAIKDAEDPEGEIAKEHLDNMVPLQKAEKDQLDIMKSLVGASRERLKIEREKLENMRKSSASKDDIQTAEVAYNNNLRAHEDIKQEQIEKIDPIREKIKAEKERYGKVVEDVKKDNDVGDNQRKYGEALQSGPIMKYVRALYDWPTATGSARREAAGKIISESRKDKNQKNIDKLEEILSKTEGKISSSGGGEKQDNSKPKE